MLRFGIISIQSDSSESLTESDTSDSSLNREEQEETTDTPSVLRLARDSNTYISDEGCDVPVTSAVLGEGISSPPEKKNNYRGSTETSTLTTPSEVRPFQEFLLSTLSESESSEEIDEDGASKDSRLLRSLSPVDSLHQIFHNDRRHDDSIVESYELSSATPYFFQPDRWSCGYRNLRMILGSLLILQIDDKNKIIAAKTLDLTSSSNAAELPCTIPRPGSESKVCLMPKDLSKRILPLAISRAEDKKQATPTRMDKSSETGREGSDGNSIRHQEKEHNGGGRPRKVPQPTGLFTCHKLIDRGNGVVPSVLEMQMLVEQAWDAGYDSEGYDIFQPEGVCGNERWIGEWVRYHTLVL